MKLPDKTAQSKKPQMPSMRGYDPDAAPYAKAWAEANKKTESKKAK